MRIWTKIMVPGIAAVAVILLGAAGASGIDEMANARIGQPAPIAAAAVADGQPPLRHLVLLGLAEGAPQAAFRTTKCGTRSTKRIIRKRSSGSTVSPAQLYPDRAAHRAWLMFGPALYQIAVT
jgi:hypothetical protein